MSHSESQSETEGTGKWPDNNRKLSESAHDWARAWGGAGPCWRQPSPAPTWHRSAGQGGPGPALAAHNNSPTTAERENPRKNTIRTTFAHLTHPNLGRGHSRVGWARLAWASLSGAAHFLESGAISETLTRQSRSGAALGFAELTAGTAAAGDVTATFERQHHQHSNTNTQHNNHY